MKACAAQADPFAGLVGDPVNVVTGANTDWNRDFQLMGPLPLDWMRYYDSSQNWLPCPLGWGHTHGYDRYLQFDVDGVRYVTPVGKALGFPPLLRDGEEFARGGVVLRRVAAHVYQARQRGQPTYEFLFRESWPAALLVRVLRGPASIRFAYGPTGFLEAIVDSLGRKIRVEHDPQGRILGLVLARRPPAKERRLLTYRYDLAGDLIEGLDPYRNPFGFRHDASHRITCKTDRRGYSFHYTYDGEGRCVCSRGEDGLHEVRLDYRPLERRTVVTRADGGEWSYFYNANKAVTAILDPYGGMVRFNLDDRGRVAEQVDPNGNVTRLLYDRAGALTGKRTPQGDFIPHPQDPSAPDPRGHRVPDCPREWEYGDLPLRADRSLPPSDAAAFRGLPDFAREFIRTATPEKLAPDSHRWGPQLNADADGGTRINGRVYNDLGSC